MLVELRNALITLFTGKILNGYPKTIRAYSGQLENIGQGIDDIPAVYVHLPEGTFRATDTLGKQQVGTHEIEIVCLVGNYDQGLSDDLLNLMEWVINSLRGATISVGGVPYAPAGLDVGYSTSLKSFGEVGIGYGIVTIKVGQIR